MSYVTVSYSHQNLVLCAKRALIGLLMFIGIAGVAHCGVGCEPAKDPTALEQSYTTAIIACAATAGYPGAYDHAADMRCRAQVDCVYGVAPCGSADGGH